MKSFKINLKGKASGEGNIMLLFCDGSLGHRGNVSHLRMPETLSRVVGWTLLCLISLMSFIKSIHPCLAVKREAVPKRDSGTTFSKPYTRHTMFY